MNGTASGKGKAVVESSFSTGGASGTSIFKVKGSGFPRCRIHKG
jgi:hypothetical protein